LINRNLKPVVEPHGKGSYRLVSDFTYQCPRFLTRVVIKAGFVFDGASIPRLFWSTTGSPFLPEYIGPGLVHDNLYRAGKESNGARISRKTADYVFGHALELNAVGWYTRYKLYQGVRLGGWKAWNKHRKKDTTAPKNS
jgi:hypothetical protein